MSHEIKDAAVQPKRPQEPEDRIWLELRFQSLNFRQLKCALPDLCSERLWVALRRLITRQRVFIHPASGRCRIAGMKSQVRKFVAMAFESGYRDDWQEFLESPAFCFSIERYELPRALRRRL